MSRLVPALVVLVPVLALVGCGGSGGSARSTPAGGAATASVEAKPAQAAETESGIPGLTVAEVEAQPPAPAVPAKFLSAATTPEQVEVEAARQAERDVKRKQSGGLDATKRTRFIQHHWWQAVREHQRSQASHIPGLTIGQLEDQPAAPPLPALFDLDSDREDLAHHAFVVASEEAATDVIGDNFIASRQLYLVWAWEPLLAQRQAKYRAALDEREARNRYQVEDARRKAQWEADIAAHQRETDRLIEIEKHKTIPVLNEQERAELDALTK